MKIRILAQIAICYFIYLITVQFYIGWTSLPTEGDSLAYHIPIARSFLSGEIIDPSLFEASPYLKYSPAASELILAPIILLGVPINIYNVIAVVVLFFVCIFSSRRVGMTKDLSIIFAVTISTINGIVRWMNTQIIDIWLLVFFLLAFGLLEKPEKSLRYFLLLGFVMGTLVGTKFTGPIFAGFLFIFYIKKLIPLLNIKRIFLFIIPFIVFGLSWYLRNFLLTGNPIYPQPIFGIKGGGSDFAILTTQVFRILSTYPEGFFMTINAYIADGRNKYVSFYAVLRGLIKGNRDDNSKIRRIFFLGLLIFITYLFLPSAMEEHITVSVFRYSLSAFTLFILGVFLLAQKYKRESVLSFIALSNIFILGFPLFYHPKLVFIYIPITLIVIYFKEVRQFLSLKLNK